MNIGTRRLQADVDRAHALAQRRRRLGVAADHEARHVDEEDERDVEAVAQLDEVGLLARGLHVHGAAVDHRVVGDDADDLAVHAREHGDQRLAEGRLDLEHRAAIDDHARSACACCRAGAGRAARWTQQLLVAAIDRIAAGRRSGGSSQTFCGM